jgi:diketogulonate reductase-like aldo/keto reductase
MRALGLGVFQTPPDETRDAVRAALDAGYPHIDALETLLADGRVRATGVSNVMVDHLTVHPAEDRARIRRWAVPSPRRRGRPRPAAHP